MMQNIIVAIGWFDTGPFKCSGIRSRVSHGIIELVCSVIYIRNEIGFATRKTNAINS